MATITVEVPGGQQSFFKKLLKQLGYPYVDSDAVAEKANDKAAAPAKKKKRTAAQQDFVDAYREMVEAENGGKPLLTSEEFFAELRKSQEEIWGPKK